MVNEITDNGEALYLRRASSEDSALLLEWRNDKLVRENSFHHEQVEPDQHRKWFASLLKDPDKIQYILMRPNNQLTTDEPVGQIRLNIEPSTGEAEIGYSIAEHARGRGYGNSCVRLAEEAITKERGDVSYLVAQVLTGNRASEAVFEHNGFVKIEELADHVVYRKKIARI